MHIYALGDLHLSFSAEKPMDIFCGWDDHVARLTDAWCQTVAEDDVVLVPGDISWAMQLSDAMEDLAYIGRLPGQKILLRGNHDYWWNGRSRVTAALPEGMRIIQNDAIQLGSVSVGGTRGWTLPESNGFHAEDQKIFDREVQRLSLSLAAMPNETEKIVMMHFPPLTEQQQDTAFTALLEGAGVQQVVYAHLHGQAHRNAFCGVHNGVQYALVSADYLQFVPKRIL